MSKHNELLYGTMEEVTYWLDQEECDEGELRAALLNAFRCIEVLQKQYGKLSEAMDSERTACANTCRSLKHPDGFDSGRNDGLEDAALEIEKRSNAGANGLPPEATENTNHAHRQSR